MANQLTREQLLEKQKLGTLTREEKVQYLETVRGMLRSDAEYVVDAKYRTETNLRGTRE